MRVNVGGPGRGPVRKVWESALTGSTDFGHIFRRPTTIATSRADPLRSRPDRDRYLPPMSAPGPRDTPTFRAATEADVDAVVDLVQSAYRGDRSRAGWTTEADLIDGQRTDAGLVLDTLARPDAQILLAELPHEDVALAGNSLVGCAEIADYSGEGGGGYFGMFAVDPTRQGRGIGGAVLDEIERIVRDDRGQDRLVLVVISLRTEMIDLYLRRGFVPTGEMHRFPYGEERYGRPRRDDLELLVMAKDLRGGP